MGEWSEMESVGGEMSASTVSTWGERAAAGVTMLCGLSTAADRF
jgi:hypothetical protein